ncbi:MAG: NADH-quinone oxidoreductase subunit L [Planctomycetes bacterium]|nr:NADH-quinone oxidoreductase subunit L [Planctomycetota bacterium]
MTAWVHDVIWLIPALPLAGFLVNAVAGRRMSRGLSGMIGVAGPVLAFVVALPAFLEAASGVLISQTLWRWIPAGETAIDVGFRVDPLASVMLLVVTGIGSLIHIYSLGYMKEDPGFSRYFAYLNLFMFSMLVLVLADNLLVMFVGWEGVGLCSYLLIGFWYQDLKNADAGKKAFVVNRVGDFGFLLGILFLFVSFGTVNFQELRSAVLEGGGAPVLLLAPAALLFLGACGKSAQIPLHVWLPDAMAGPTPVSALIHAATMVTAGVYMIGRLDFLYVQVPEIMKVVAIVAAATALLAALIAVVQTDIKKVLAYSTISQLGFMFAGMASTFFYTGTFHIVTHAFFKALLFLGAGAVIHALHGEQDIRKMGGLAKSLPGVFLTFICGAVALAGLPGSAGFFSKDAILQAVYARANMGYNAFGFVWIALLATAFLTAFYSARLLVRVFFGAAAEPRHDLHRPGSSMFVPLVVLAVGSLFAGGLLNPWMERFLSGGQVAAHGTAPPHAHALNATLSWILSLSGFGAAFALYALRGDLAARFAESDLGRVAYRWVSNKFYVDEAYHWTVVAGTKTAAAALWLAVDRVLIDALMVEGAGWLAYRAGTALKRVHTGVISLAAGAMAVGSAGLLAYVLYRILNHG